MQDAQWFGVGQSEALLVLREPTADRRLQGELSVCFADRTKSCVQGAFEADYCQRSIDAPVRGTQLMESPAAVERSNLEQSPDAGRDSEAKP
jgi:hypothetical protein